MSDNSFLIQTTFRAAIDAATYSASVVLNVTSRCRCDDQVAAPFARQMTYPVADLRVSISPA